MTEHEPVTVEALDVVRAPGFETGGFEIEAFAPGVNLVHGPNGAGKTTTADAIVRVLWPDVTSDGEQVVGRLSTNGTTWRVHASNGSAEYQRDGQEASAPNLPSADARDRYRLALHDLLQRETRNERFAEVIERESAGGYDLAAARDELGYDDSPTTRRAGVYQTAEDAVQAWRDRRSEAEGLEEDRSRLTKLESELEDARRARDERDTLDQAITYREAVAELRDARATLEEFPAVLERVDGDEGERVDDLESDIAEWEAQRRDARATKSDAEATLASVDLPEGGVEDGVLARLKRRRDELDERESRVAELEDELEGARTERRSARRDVPLDVDRDGLADLDPGSWAEVAEFARTADDVRAAERQRAAIEQWGEVEDPPDAEDRTLERASKALEDWLMAEPADEARRTVETAFRVGAASATAVAIAGGLLGALVDRLLYGVVLLGVGLFLYAYRQRAGAADAADERASHRESFEGTGLEPPAAWNPEAVRDRLVEVYDALAELELAEERRRQREAMLNEVDLERQASRLEEKRAELREAIGVAPERTDVELAVIVRRVLDWQAAHDEVLRLEAELEETEDSLREARDALRADLAEYGYEDVADAATATERIHDLERRASVHETATRELENAAETIERAESKLEELRADRDAVYAELDLEPGDRDALASLCERVPEYEDASRAVERAETVVEREREELRGCPAYEPELEEAELSELRRRRSEAAATAERYDDLQGEVSDIEARIRDAKASTDVEDAIERKERALADLEDQYEADAAATVGDVLVDHVQEETVAASRPEVFQRASEVLATITHGRYRLDLAEGERTFRAYDTAEQRGLALDELSAGTRVQVLLAVRLAFVELQEQGMRLPIILDETLANTDDRRAEVIVESTIELARSGRQVFYFTAQGDEVARWRAALEDAPDVEWTTVDLARVRDLEAGVRPPAVDDVETLVPEPPDPAGHDRESYAEAIDVPAFDPYAGAGTAHLWYLVEDLDALHELLQLGVERWGQLRTLLEHGRDGVVAVDDGTLEAIRQHGAAVEEFVQAWRVGRGERVDRSALEASGAVTDRFIDRVAELAEDLGGDGERLVQALYDGEVDRFRRDKAEELEEYLRANGYVVSSEPLEDDEVRLRVTERLIDEGVDRRDAAERAATLLERVARA